MNHRIYWLLVLILAWMTNSPRATACNIPVFRYALERWRADRDEDCYRVIVFHRGSLTEHQSLLDTLSPSNAKQPARANLVVETVDLSRPIEPSLRQLWQSQKDGKPPWMMVRVPNDDEEQRTLWAGSLDNNSAKQLKDSPVRRDLAQRLMKGDSIVWLLLECGDKKRDDAAAATLQTQLQRLEKELHWPDPAGDDSVELLSNLPRRLAFSMVRVKRTDPAETMLIAMLLHTDSDLAKSTEPMVFPVFGRGRVLDALIGKGINAGTIQDTAKFLCGACSCQVKRLNPGVDLLMAADWDAVLEDRDSVPVPRSSLKGERVRIPTPRQRSETGDNKTVPARDESKQAFPVEISTLIAVAIGVILALSIGVLTWRSRRRGKYEA
ncbi:MAG TPA: hypothetical protein VN688_17500 [Gemmataceae bacterium]|nr:hypothetical protein [Gemmataceae bacterium]